MGEDLQVVSVADLWTPQFAREVAAPDTALWGEFRDHLSTGTVQVATRIRFGSTSGDKCQFRMCAWKFGESQNIAHNCIDVRTGFDVQAVVNDEAQLRMTYRKGFDLAAVLPSRKHIDDDTQFLCSAPQAVDSRIISFPLFAGMLRMPRTFESCT